MILIKWEIKHMIFNNPRDFEWGMASFSWEITYVREKYDCFAEN